MTNELINGLVTVVMPVYNGEKYLAGAIESMIAQTYAQWELVLVDDGSVDDTAVIARQFSDPRIRYHYQENRGQAAALNTGLRLARGEFVTTLDADDWYPTNSLQQRIDFLMNQPTYGAVYGDGLYCYESGNAFLRFTEQMPAGVIGDVYDTLIVSPFYGTGATVMVRRSVLLAHGVQYDDSIVWCQDWDFYIRLAEVAAYGFVPDIMINYRLHASGMTVAMPKGRRLDSLIRTRQKVMASGRFTAVADEQKAAFFYDYLMQDLGGNIAAQDAVFASDAFQTLSRPQQSRLLRIAAIDYLRQDKESQTARRWLRQAWAHRLTDPKTAVVTSLAHIHTGTARRVINRWQAQRADERLASPFETAVTTQTSEVSKTSEV